MADDKYPTQYLPLFDILEELKRKLLKIRSKSFPTLYWRTWVMTFHVGIQAHGHLGNSNLMFVIVQMDGMAVKRCKTETPDFS